MFEAKIIIDQDGKKTVSLEMDIQTLSSLHTDEVEAYMHYHKKGYRILEDNAHLRQKILFNALVDADYFDDPEVTKYEI